MSFLTHIFLVVSGFVAGTIDAIAGGGGLITLPIMSEILEPGANAVGTNKIVGFMAAFIALLVYLRKQPLHLKKGFVFVAAVGAGALVGSICNPHVPKFYFKYFLMAVCPLVLWVIWNKKIFIEEAKDHGPRAMPYLVAAGLAAGFYDGFFGPGGGTFMLLGLLWGVRLPLFQALILSKLANTVSAGIALVSYGVQGYVHPIPGIVMSIGVTAGGYLGARIASNRAEKIVRPVLAFVVVLLLLENILKKG